MVAVEPQASLRDKLAERVGAERMREGVAEEIPLEDGSVAAVTVADAFHWFDRQRALTEIGRVLRPGQLEVVRGQPVAEAATARVHLHVEVAVANVLLELDEMVATAQGAKLGHAPLGPAGPSPGRLPIVADRDDIALGIATVDR